MPMIETDINQQDDIPGLTPQENRKVVASLVAGRTNSELQNLGEDADLERNVVKSRFAGFIGQAAYFQEEINIAERDINNAETPEQREVLETRINGLTIARDMMLDLIELERVRNQQEEDVSRLQRFKEWAKENIPGLSALAISIAGIITTIVIGARKAIIKGAQATSRFAKAVANLAKKLWPVLGPLLNLVAQAISWGVKGLAWLASNLWVLVLAFAWFIYDQYKQKRNKK